VDLDRVTLLESRIPVEITPEHVVLAPTDETWQATDGPRVSVPAERVVVEIGFLGETSLLADAGVTFGDDGAPIYDPETMQAAPGVYLAGTATAAGQGDHEMFIETSHVHVHRITNALTSEKESPND
jgi:thioredoxin reductase